MGSVEETKALRDNEAYIKWWSRKFKDSMPSLDIEDIEQEASIAFLRAFRAHSPERGCLQTVAGKYIRQHLMNLVQSDRRLRRGRLSGRQKCGDNAPAIVLSLDEDAFSDAPKTRHEVFGFADPGFERFEKRQLHELALKAGKKLSSRTREMLRQRHVEDKTLDEIGKSVGLHRERVRQVLKDGHTEMRKHFKQSLTPFERNL